LIAQEHGESPHPINHDPHNGHNTGNVQDKGERLHVVSRGIGPMILRRRGEINLIVTIDNGAVRIG
jgi:hypothetical protein